MSERVSRYALAAILVLFVGTGLAYAFTTPTLEAPDEIYHYGYIRSLVNTGLPPVLEAGGGRGFGHHAPLYYALGALASFWVGENDLERWPERENPFFGYRFGDVGRDNKNLYLHPDDDCFGSSDTWLGIRVVRVLSVLMGAFTVWAIYRVGREVFPERPEMAVGAAGLAAFIPEFLFISGAVNDDNGAAACGALALWAMMRLLRRGPSTRRLLALGAALGLGWLSKLTVASLVGVAVLTLLLLALRRRSWREAVRWGLVVFGVLAVLVVPWLVRQTVLYGDPTGTAREVTEWGEREEPVRLSDLGPDLYWLRTSFWGRLGYNQIPLSEWIYVLLDVVALAAVFGLLRLVVKRRGLSLLEPGPAQIFTLAVAIVFSVGPMVVRRFLRPMPNFGRYLFPVLPAIALLLFTGLAAWVPRRQHSRLALGGTVGMLVLGVGSLFFFLAPAYAGPAIYSVDAAPEPPHRLDWLFLEDEQPLAVLLGYGLDREAVEPGETVHLTLYWQAQRETSTDYVLFAQLFGREAARVGQRDTYPGLGHYPTSFWRAGEVIVDEVPIPVSLDAAAPSRLRVDVGLYQRGGGQRLQVVDEAGRPVGAATATWLRLASSEEVPQPEFPADYRLGDDIALVGYELASAGGELDLTLYWAPLAVPERDFTVFAHLEDAAGALVAQGDGQPVGGDYPTSFWVPGEVVVDRRLVPMQGLPPGVYHLRVGMYLLETGERLPASDGRGAPLPDGVIPLVTVEWEG